MSGYKDMIFIKKKESILVRILLLLVGIVLIVPIILIFSLRFIYKLVQNIKESISVSTPADTNLNKVY
jgi:Na+-transporting methylmalonyl-CoA/oxaloacetate decarboxylase gamma subunit